MEAIQGLLKAINVTVTLDRAWVINVGPVQGSINTNVHALMSGGGSQEQVAVAIKELAAAISGSELGDVQNKEAREMLTPSQRRQRNRRRGGLAASSRRCSPRSLRQSLLLRVP
jgi:hypothetical protein